MSQTPRGRWLFKEEPSHYSFDDLLRDKTTTWDGVENNLALKYLRGVRKGDDIIFYHTGDEKSAVGLMKAVSDAHHDPNSKEERLVAVEVRAEKKPARPVKLSEIKADPFFAGFDLVRISRLSVMPVPEKFWNRILDLSEKKLS
jgi:predicted RNA-binding protein with PUA-like domain